MYNHLIPRGNQRTCRDSCFHREFSKFEYIFFQLFDFSDEENSQNPFAFS